MGKQKTEKNVVEVEYDVTMENIQHGTKLLNPPEDMREVKAEEKKPETTVVISPKERQEALEKHLVEMTKKEILAEEIYKNYKNEIKKCKEEIALCMEERKAEEKMPLLREMIRLDRESDEDREKRIARQEEESRTKEKAARV